jgi:2-polyprenyl-3-methyl-5-hydroxy-6-metoxy-1,4-benzoquinol methylase
VSDNGWLRMIEENPRHSTWYIERFRSMAAAGQDLDGEARFVDAMVPRGARILDAGCGPGRVGGRLAALGHHGAVWLARDLAVFDLASEGIAERFDVIVSAGNVMTFLDPVTRRAVLHRLSTHLAPDGRLAVGFGAGRGYEFDDFFADAASVGLRDSLRLSSWDLRPFDASSTFLVAVLTSR